MECGMKIIKYLLFAFNFVFFIVALAMIGVGAAVEIKYRAITAITASAISAAPILIICVGVFILIVAFFGCCGAYKENYCMVTSFMVMMVIIFILEFSAGIAAFALKNKLESWVTVAVKNSLHQYSPAHEKVFNTIQVKFKCCGALNANDWKNSTTFQKIANATLTKTATIKKASLLVPDSCCRKVTKNCGLTLGHHIYNNTNDGCVKKIEAFIKKNAGVIGGIGFGIAVIQILGIVFACCLMQAIRKQYEVV